MNDTMSIWHDVWKCPDDPRTLEKHHDVTIVLFAATILAVIIGLFYAGSYVQTENEKRNLIQCEFIKRLFENYAKLHSIVLYHKFTRHKFQVHLFELFVIENLNNRPNILDFSSIPFFITLTNFLAEILENFQKI